VIGTWLGGLLRRRPARLGAAAVGVAVAVALLASLGSFLAHSKATMTDRAVRGVAVDWQVQVTPGTDPATISQIANAGPGVRSTATVNFAQTTGLTAQTGGSTHSTGPGVVLGIPADYQALFPTEIRPLAGAAGGVLLAQQTAANLHAAPGDVINIGRAGAPPAQVTVAGVADLPQADSLFQKVGAPVGAQRTAPPDNVVLLPQSQWHSAFDSLAAARPDQVSTQIQVLRDHRLPQDLRPSTITNATALQNTYFQGGTANGLMHTLAAQPDSILVSAETVKDYQLQVGDPVTLRLLDAHTHQPRAVTFRYVGVVSEFPTAPKDSFFVANSSYVAQQTGSVTVGAFLVNTGGQHSAAVAQQIQTLLGTSATVTDISSVRKSVGSSLTAVDLAGLTRVELSFALVLAAAAGGLVFALGLSERRRTFAIVSALGAKPRHLRQMIFSEAAVLIVVGVLTGALLGWVLAEMLVKVLTGVFDPPPSAIAIPWLYLSAVGVITIGAVAAVSAAAARIARRPAISVLREL